jgi:two-component system sensor histidine kinase RegB
LGNLLENAIDFAASKVRLEASWTLTDVSIEIADDGPGFAPEILNRLGEPYVTTRPGIRAATDDGFGLGLGVFIAKTLLERSSATVTTKNAVLPETGARVVITWPRSVFERKPDSIAWEEEIRRG